jgi:hypothetical protein
MPKTITPSTTNNGASSAKEENLTTNENRPSPQVIRNILAFSKALKATETKTLGTVLTVKN